MNFETWLQSDLTKPLKVQALHGVFFSADNAANLIGVEVFSGGTAASLSGTCVGYAIRADGGTLPITGTVSGNKASIILPTSAYVIEGPLDIVIKVVSGSVKTTVGACRGYVQRATTDTIIDPGHVIPSLEELLALIEPMEEATDAANAAAASANSAASNANSKATAAHTAATNANEKATIANTAATNANAARDNANTAAAAANAAAAAAPTQITNQATTYQNSTSGTTIPTGTWLDTQPNTPQGQFLWIRTILTWNNGQTTTMYSVSRMGIDGSGSVMSVNGISPDANGNVSLPIDATPTQGSQNPVTSGGIYNAEQSIRNTVAIVATGNTAPKAITSGQYVIWNGALYTATANIASGATLSTSNLQAVPNGGLNALISKISPDGYMSAIRSSTYLSDGSCSYTQIGKIVLVLITDMVISTSVPGQGATYSNAFFTGLPKPLIGMQYNLTQYSSNKTLRVSLTSGSNNDGAISPHWNAMRSSSDQWYGVLWYIAT